MVTMSLDKDEGFHLDHVDLSIVPSSVNPIGGFRDESFDVLNNLLKNGQTSQFKELLRTQHWPIRHPIRSKLWIILCRHLGDGKHIPQYYETTLKELLGDNGKPPSLPIFCEPIYNASYCLSTKGLQALDRVLCVLAYSHPTITYCPLLYPLGAIFLHFISEAETYLCLCDILSAKKDDFVSQSKAAHDARAIVASKMAKKYAKQGYSTLLSAKNRHQPSTRVSKPISDDPLQKTFYRWLCWLFRGLPFPLLIRVMDCFLLEGSKIFLRTLLAMLQSFAKQQNSNGTVKGHRSPDKRPSSGLSEEVFFFCQNSLGPPDRFLKMAFGIKGLSRREIQKRLVQAEMSLKSQSSQGGRRVSLETVPSSDSLYQLHMTSESLACKETKMRSGEILRAHSLGMMPLKDFQSGILTAEQMTIIWSWIPMRITMNQPHLVYSTNEHGSSLTAFFMRVDPWEPIIMLIKADNDQVFGAYCSTSWAERNTKDDSGKHRRYFGTGETFLFSLTPNSVKYSWVGVEARSSVKHSQELFMAADKQWICIGSGNGQGLWLDESLAFGKTEHCDTFDNPPLCSDRDFAVKVIEVISFQ